jgi:hypothetical protein
MFALLLALGFILVVFAFHVPEAEQLLFIELLFCTLNLSLDLVMAISAFNSRR